MAENFLAKKIGPFSGGVWIVVVGGGIGLAILLKKGMGGGTPPANQPILVENVPLRNGGGVTSWNDPSIPPKDPPKTIPTPTLPKPVIPPTAPKSGTPIPVVPNKPPAKPPTCPPGYAWNAIARECMPVAKPALPVIPKPPTPPPPKPGGPTIPGGGSSGCDSTSGYFPPDYVARKNMDTSTFMNRAIKLSWAIQNIAAGPSGIYALTQWISSPLVWPLVNSTRRNRGLRPLSDVEFKALILKLNTIIVSLGGKENRLTNAQIMEVWETFNTPFVCTSFPTRTGSRATVKTGAA